MYINNSELLILFISSLSGSIVVVLTNHIASKYGSIAGLITTIPSNTLISLCGLSLITEDIISLKKNIFLSIVFSPIITFYLFFFWIKLPCLIDYKKYSVLDKHKIKINTFVGFIIWFSITLLINKFIINNIKNKELYLILSISLFVFLINFYLTTLIKINNKLKVKKQRKKIYSRVEIIINFCFSFFIIFMIIFIGKINESIGAVLSLFPSITFLNSVIVWNKTNDSNFIHDLNLNTIFGGVSIYMYVLIYGILFDNLGIWKSILISFMISFIFFNIPVYITLKTKQNDTNIEKKPFEEGKNLNIIII